MPISPPKPNSPPSANWVEAFHSTIALSTRPRKYSAAEVSSAMIASVWPVPKLANMGDGFVEVVHRFHRQHRR